MPVLDIMWLESKQGSNLFGTPQPPQKAESLSTPWGRHTSVEYTSSHLQDCKMHIVCFFFFFSKRLQEISICSCVLSRPGTMEVLAKISLTRH